MSTCPSCNGYGTSKDPHPKGAALEFALHRRARPAPKGAGLEVVPPYGINRSTVTDPVVFPFFLDSGHTYVSCPHRDQHCQRSTLWPKSGYPNRVSSSSAGTAERASLQFALSVVPINRISTISAGSSPPNARGLVGH